ncbi:hypothetical protein BJG92_00451 [Arthrobacter sp. SO5]|nr:hypothetical protein [Arthrobacter sp. SO5]
MKTRTFIRSRAVGVAGALLLGGCASPQTQGSSASWANAYPTLRELTGASDAILVGTVQKSTPVPAVDGIPFTDATVAVKTWLKGTPAASAITVHQTGSAARDTFVSAGDPIMEPGESSMLFVLKNSDGTYTALSGPTGRLLISGTAVEKMPETSLAESLPGTLPELIAAVKRLL